MSTVKNIAKNTGFLLIGRIATKIISLFTVIYIVRYLGDAGYGRYAFAFAFVSFFTIIANFGIHSILVREIARSPQNAKKMLGNATIISFILSIISLIIAIFVIRIINYPAETEKIVQIAAVGLLIYSLSPFGVIYEVNLKMKYSVLFGLLSRLFMLSAVILTVSYDLGITWLVAATVASDALHGTLMMIFSKRFIWPEFKIDINMCKFLLKEAYPLALASVFIIIYFRIDVVMLSLMDSDAAVGTYSAAYRLTEALIFIPSTFMVSMFPLMSRYFNESKENLVFAYMKSFKYLFIIAAPLAVGITFFAYQIILLLYGDQFSESIGVLQILIWAIALIFINYSLAQFLVSTNRQKITTFSTAICALLNVALNLILIPHLSYQGAAIATVVTELVSMCIMIYYLPQYVSKLKLIYEIRAPFIATSFMFIFLLFTYDHFNSLFVVVISTMVYFISIYIFGGIDKDDKRLLSKLIYS